MRRRNRRLHGLGRLSDKANCEIHVFSRIKSPTGKGMARKKVCYKRKVSAAAKKAWAANLKKACKAQNLPDSLKKACAKKTRSRRSAAASA
jgi:hypothetical protein